MTLGGDPYSAENRRRVDLPYYYRLSIPKNTSSSGFYTATLELPRGESEYLWIEMPKGCAGLVGIQLWHYTWQIFPRPYANWYISDNTLVKFRFREVFTDDKPAIEIRGYNVDQLYTHAPWIALEMVALRSAVSNSVVALLDFLGRNG